MLEVAGLTPNSFYRLHKRFILLYTECNTEVSVWPDSDLDLSIARISWIRMGRGGIPIGYVIDIAASAEHKFGPNYILAHRHMGTVKELLKRKDLQPELRYRLTGMKVLTVSDRSVLFLADTVTDLTNHLENP